MSCRDSHEVLLNDTLTPFAFQIVDRNNDAVDLTGKTVKFFMHDLDGNQVLVPTNATVVTASTGHVTIDLPTSAVDEAGEFLGYFQVINGSELQTYPAQGILVTVYDPEATNTTPDPATITDEDIVQAAKSPRRVRTVEGTVEERSISDLIKADQYASAKAATAVPWGMRIAKTKPPSTLS